MCGSWVCPHNSGCVLTIVAALPVGEKLFCVRSCKYYNAQARYTYRSVPHIRPPFCNLSGSQKHGGSLYAGSDILSREYTLPRLDVDIGTLYYRPIEAAVLLLLLILSSPEPQRLDGQDRLTEVGHSVDSGVF